MSILKRRDFLALAKRFSVISIFSPKMSAEVQQPTQPQFPPPAPPVVGPGTDDATWELSRQAQQRMSDYIQKTILEMRSPSRGATITINYKAAPKYQYIPQMVSEDDEGPEGALHEDFPLAPNRFNPDTGRFFTDEGNEFNPRFDLNFEENVGDY